MKSLLKVYVRTFFSEKKVTVGVIYNYLLKHSKCVGVDDFCRLYILIGISEFLLPNRNGTVFPHTVQDC